ncbi:hypothetical protein [Oceanobacillus manasiensis]|uniref:hypothetical protein n=1 Tax=Oceanobacillus manasiensis TaxID=586413 RepID=UPI000693AC32|nr:hypothetical protein [Oceanobacillus manasiensis]
MKVETLPNSFSIIYIIFISLALITAIISNVKDKLIPFAYLTIILSIGAPLFSFLYTVERPSGSNELSHLFHQVGSGHIAAFILLLSNVYLICWIILFIWAHFGKTIKKYSLMFWNKLRDSRFWAKLRKQRGE